MKIDVLIVFEHASRELESAILLEKKLKDIGYIVKVVQASWDENVSHLIYNPKLVVIPWCYDETEYDLYCRYKGSLPRHNFKILNLHCEQLTNANARYLLIPKGKAKNVYHIAWGEYFRSELLKAGVNDSLISVTGSNRLDFFRNEYRKVSKSKKELAKKYSINCNRKWILLIGNFSLASFSKQDLKTTNNKGYKDINVLSELAEKTYYTILEWIKKACKQSDIYEKVEFIYRPHPSELQTDELRKISYEYDNFHIISELAIRDWIVNSDMAFSWCSTSAIEVNAANIPIYNLRPYDIPDNFKIPLLEYIEQLHTCEEFTQKVRNSFMIKKDKLLADEKFRQFTDYYYKQSDKSATEMTINTISKIINEEGNFAEKKPWFLFGIIKSVNYYIKRILYLINISNNIDKYRLLNESYISKRVVKDCRKKIERALQ